MFLWHVAGTIGIVRYAFRDDRMDLRFLILGAVLPDLLDTPVGFFWFEEFRAVRLLAHSIVFASVVMVIVVASTRRGRPRKRLMPLAIGTFVHLVLDAMWANPETLWWPFLGLDFTATDFSGFGDLAGDVIADWRVWALEVVGAVYLGYLAVRGNLRSVEERRRFVRTGRIAVPIDRR